MSNTLIPAPHVGRAPEWTLADRLRKSREAAGLEQSDLALSARISRATISAAENGRRIPSRASIALWAMATGVPRGWLTGEIPTLEDSRSSALLALITAARYAHVTGHATASQVLDAVATRERAVQDSGEWSGSSAIHHPEVVEWCERFRPELASALAAAENECTPWDLNPEPTD